MKVFVLGAYGKVGLPASKMLTKSDSVSEVALAGRNMERATEAADMIGEKAIAVEADGLDERKLSTLLAGYDIVVNAAYNDTVLSTVRAAMRAGTHYCDTSWGDVLGQVLQLSPEAEAAGTTAIIANGIHPCISNLMGVHAARQLDVVEQLQSGFGDVVDFASGKELTPGQWLEDPRKNLAALNGCKDFVAWILQVVGESGLQKALDYQERMWKEINPVRDGMDVPSLEHGMVRAYPYASCEDFGGGLPRGLSKATPVEMYFSPLPPQLHNLLRNHFLRLHEEKTSHDIVINSFYDAVESEPARWLTLQDDLVRLPKLWLRAVGHKEGRAARFTCWFTGSMWDVGGYLLNSAALAVTAFKIIRGEIGKPGIMTAEATFEPVAFFDEVVAVLPEPPSDRKLINESFEWLE